ncbi:glycosyltransferase family 2 protein [Chitinophaga pendula]|uniref:glycosyltransferase family 2 protein n=1 Tax=Chitinophaga TaxID=79328 RepID=UPI000BAE945A|nr:MULTISPECIES: glycosyltransferase family 2 protein [Chitinophaga]ASZ13322.1 glycosyl transferase [Chitinophaga sp. MD30]UCJ09053.1 glycosyltransferase family 2 protein [Chitinophaga pendula]
MSTCKLSIVIPAYNEELYIHRVIERVYSVSLPGNMHKEIIIVDDHSTDATGTQVAAFHNTHPDADIRYIRHERNQGKGAALRTGIQIASGDFLIIQDADLEYDPEEYKRLLEPILLNQADVVYGSRFKGLGPHRILFFWHTIGNKFLTFLSNMFTNLNLTDMETCYKLFRRDIIANIPLRENRFGFEPEITAKISRIPGIRIFEVGIAYYGRTYHEGKKINYRDGCRAIFCILKYNIYRYKPQPANAHRTLLNS